MICYLALWQSLDSSSNSWRFCLTHLHIPATPSAPARPSPRQQAAEKVITEDAASLALAMSTGAKAAADQLL
jgi:hypothetical protein